MLQDNSRYSYCANLATINQGDTNQKIKTTSLYHHEQLNVMLLTIPAGQTIKEHVSPKLLTLQIIAGRGSITVDNETHTVETGAWFYIEPNTPHELVSDETLHVLLNMYTQTEPLNGAV